MSQSVGSFAFLIGFVLAVILGIIAGAMPGVLSGASGWVLLVLIILGLVVGILNIKDAHLGDFLIAVIAITMVGVIPVQQFAQLIPQLSPIISVVFQNIVAFAAPAALIAGLRQIWVLAYQKAN